MSGRYASYWNAFLLNIYLLPKEYAVGESIRCVNKVVPGLEHVVRIVPDLQVHRQTYSVSDLQVHRQTYSVPDLQVQG